MPPSPHGPHPVVLLHTLTAFVSLLLVGSSLATAAEQPEPAPRDVRSPWQSGIQGTPTPPEPFRIEPIYPDLRFDHPISMLELPGTDRMLIAEIGGRVLTFPQAATVDKADVAGELKRTAFGAVVHPDFEQNGFLYLCLVHTEGGAHSRVSRFKVSTEGIPKVDLATETVIITWPSGGHNGGCLRFGSDGMLYIATGDGSGPNPPDGLTTGQDVTDLLGAILRIDVDRKSDGKNYAIPSDNPFVNHVTARPEIFGYGLRNPFRFGIDPKTNDVFVADNGWETWEMVHLVQSGTNCGWPIMEGRAQLRTEVTLGPTQISLPIRDHHHSEANSVIGGPVYRGGQIPSLQGQFIYGDYITGTIWSVGRTEKGTFEGQTLVDTDLRIIDFLEGHDGALLVLDYDLTGQIYRIVPNTRPDLSRDFPRQLSRTGLFSDVKALQPSPGVEPYSVIVPRWTDGAEATRFVAVPGDQAIELSAHALQRGSYPDGTVFVKHLTVPAALATLPQSGDAGKPLETQLLHYWNGTWNPYSYLWNDEGTDAELVGAAGTVRSVKWPDAGAAEGNSERTWRTSAVNECRLCHNAGPGFVLGFVGNQLNYDVQAEQGDRNQLSHLAARKVIAAPPDSGLLHEWTLVDSHDASQPLDDRARSWLHGNCSMCHHKGGNAIVSFFLTKNLTFEQMNMVKGTGIGTFGMTDARIVVPGDPYRSVMMYRISKLGYARMPYIGSQVVDSHGVSLIGEWIRSMPPLSNRELSLPLVPESEDSEALTLLHDESTSHNVRLASIQSLTATTEGSLALAESLHRGQLSMPDQTAVTETVRNASSDIRGLFDHFLPESRRKKTLGRTFDPSLVLSATGDLQRGRLIFFSDAARCRACHQPDDAANSVGPSLAEIARKYPRSSDLLDHVLKPSQKIEDKYAAWTAVLNDGRLISGLLLSETPDQITLKTAERQIVALSRSEIEELQRSPKSLMPDGVLADLTAEEAADLMAFIQSQTTGQ
jgi:putative heme-binding domain-containing protein